ncbi:hypothetical protein BCON_0143g00170 [Botryotinia convoluta]|uniref:Uncharacterized protein n=1 Tax=Botryotinia convoluta TaxID=54673 RepID=A0A4Z1HTV4_9HELO|nr:hypothetical protein BCON_0143g00170 [Botryotinia convoluta]
MKAETDSQNVDFLALILIPSSSQYSRILIDHALPISFLPSAIDQQRIVFQMLLIPPLPTPESPRSNA